MAMDANADMRKHNLGLKRFIAAPLIAEMCAANSLVIPSLCDEGAADEVSNQTTYEKDGVEYTIDYVAVSTSIQVIPGSAGALPAFDTNGFEDHLPTMLTVIAPGACVQAGRRRRVVGYDRRAAQQATQEQLELFRAGLAAQPVVPYWIDPSTHQHLTDAWVQQILETTFPKQRRPPRPPELSEEAARLYDARGRVLGKARFLGRDASRRVLGLILECWKIGRVGRGSDRTNSRMEPRWCPVRGFTDKQTSVNIALLHLVAADIRQEAVQKEKADEDEATEKRNKALVAAIDGNDVTAMHSMTRKTTQQWQPRVSPSIKLESGEVVSGHVPVKKRWRQHFTSLMEGVETTLADTIERDRRRQERRPNADVKLDLDIIPTNLERAKKMTRYKVKSGIGEDRVGAEILKFNSGAISSSMAALTLKACLQISVPVQAKGGHIVELYKGKGARLECDSYRDITLGHVMSKPLAACMRDKAHGTFAKKALDTQFGALRHRGTEMAALCMRAAFDFATATRRSCAGIFVDVEKAYARLCRAIAFPPPESDEILASRLCAAGLSHEAVFAVLAKARTQSAWSEAGESRHLRAMMEEMHTHTWASCEHLNEVALLFGGTLAGHALGDIVFTAAMALVLAEVRDSLRAEGAIETYGVTVYALTGESHRASSRSSL